MHLTKIENQKKAFEKRERKGIKTLFLLFPYPFAFEILKCFQITQPWGWLDATLNKLSKYINFIKFGIWIKPQLFVLQKVLLIGITMPLIKIQTKDIENIKPMLWQASTSHKLPIYALITKFGNG